jgi:glutamyl/glutaminyl-tRNA synthetase
VASALYVWGLGRRLGADVLLRIEDHDAQRSRPEYERALLDDLDWLGFAPDRYPTVDFRTGRCESRQSDRTALYAEHATRLIDRGLVYGCRCSRKTKETGSRPVTSERSGVLDPGTHRCPTLGLPLKSDIAWRLRLPAGQRLTFDDGLLGLQEQWLAPDEADVVIRDRHGNWTYQFAVSVDDYLQGITLVIRGDDLLASTATQIAIGALCGRPVPARFVHHPLLMASPTRKLSKSSGDTGIADLRAAGWQAPQVIGEAASRAGLAPTGSQIHAIEAECLFGYTKQPPQVRPGDAR